MVAKRLAKLAQTSAALRQASLQKEAGLGTVASGLWNGAKALARPVGNYVKGGGTLGGQAGRALNVGFAGLTGAAGVQGAVSSSRQNALKFRQAATPTPGV